MPRMTERATSRESSSPEAGERKLPHKVRTGVRTEGDGDRAPVGSYTPFTWRDWKSPSKHFYMARFTIYHVNRVYMLGLSGLHAPFRFYMD